MIYVYIFLVTIFAFFNCAASDFSDSKSDNFHSMCKKRKEMDVVDATPVPLATHAQYMIQISSLIEENNTLRLLIQDERTISSSLEIMINQQGKNLAKAQNYAVFLRTQYENDLKFQSMCQEGCMHTSYASLVSELKKLRREITELKGLVACKSQEVLALRYSNNELKTHIVVLENEIFMLKSEIIESSFLDVDVE